MGGNPGNIDLHRQDEIGVDYEGARVVAEVHGMRRWQRQIARVELREGNGKSIGELSQSIERSGIAARAGRQDQRILGPGDHLRRLGDGFAVGRGRRRGTKAGRCPMLARCLHR